MNYTKLLLLFILLPFLIITSCTLADPYIDISSFFLSGPPGDNNGNGGTSVPNYYKNISDAMTDGLIGYWKMDEDSGVTSVDETGTQNGTSTNTTITDGKFGKCRIYNPTVSGRTDITGITSTTQSYTLCFYMYVVNASDCYYFDTGTGRFLVGIRGGTFQVYNSTDSWQDYTTVPTTGTWLHVVNVLDNATGNATLYIDGQPSGNVVSWTGKNIGGGTSLGCRYQFGSQFYDGYFDDVAFWDRVLTAQEISDIYDTNYPLVAD